MVHAADISPAEHDKRNRLLRAIHHRGRATRLQLARELHISNSRVCELVDRMLGAGLLREPQEVADRRGRRGVELVLDGGYGHLVGFDVEAKRLRLLVLDFAGGVVWQGRRPLPPSPGDDFDLGGEVLGFIDESLAQAREQVAGFNPLAFGLAASGVIDTRRGVILHYDLLPQAVDVPLRDLIADHVGLPCVMENNIRALTLAEWTGGAGVGLDSFVCLAVRSGVGAGIVLGGRLLSGSHGLAGEAGYMPLPQAGPASGWKNLQQAVSETALSVDAEAAKNGLDPAAARRAGELVGGQLAAIAALLDPEALVLAGGLLAPDGPLWPHMERAYRATALKEIVERVPLLPAQLGPFAAARGAAHRCLQELFPVAPPPPT